MICNRRFKKRIELCAQEQPLVAGHGGGAHSHMKRPRPQPPHTRGTFHRRPKPLYTEQTQGFVLRLPPQNKAHATVMQPLLECVLQHRVANPHASRHMATEHDNNHAAIPMRSATRDSRNEWNYAHRNNHSLQNTEEEPIRAWNDRSCNRRTHEVPFIAGRSHFTQENTRFRAPASSPKPAPCNIHATITMRFAASRG